MTVEKLTFAESCGDGLSADLDKKGVSLSIGASSKHDFAKNFALHGGQIPCDAGSVPSFITAWHQAQIVFMFLI